MTSQPLSVSSHPLYRHHTHSLYDITLAISLASSLLYKTSHPHFLVSNDHFEDIILTILDIVSTVSVSSHQHYRWYHSHYMYDVTSSICETFSPLYLWHCTHYVWHHNRVCWLQQFRHSYDIICAIEDVTFTLSHQATIFMTSHPLQAWHHTPCIRHRTNCIFVIITAPLISHPHLYDITPTICVTSYALYITSYPLVMSSHYCTYDSTTLPLKPHPGCSSKYTLSMWHQSHMSVSSHPLYWEHHNQSLYDIILGIGIASFALLKTLHPHFMKSNHHFYDITPTVFDIILMLFL